MNTQTEKEIVKEEKELIAEVKKEESCLLGSSRTFAR